MELIAYEGVRIVRLRVLERAFDGTDGIARAPRIGDVGAIVHVHSPTECIVECVDQNGLTVWLADFHEDELEHDSRPAP